MSGTILTYLATRSALSPENITIETLGFTLAGTQRRVLLPVSGKHTKHHHSTDETGWRSLVAICSLVAPAANVEAMEGGLL